MEIIMTEIVLASNNKKKIAELQHLFDRADMEDVKILSLHDIGYSGDIEEYGRSFEENSLIKAAVPASLGYIGIADDSGLCVDALGGEPGIYSARYSEDEGEADDRDAANRAKLLRNLEGVPDEARTGAFVCVMSAVLPENTDYKVPEKYRAAEQNASFAGTDSSRCITVRGECRGVITREEIGEGGFGYDNLFYSPELLKTFAEATADEKSSVSHRGRAVEKFVKILAEIINTKNKN